MTRQEFSKFMNQLTVIYAVESRAHEDLEILVDTYFKFFANHDVEIFSKAIDLIIETHSDRMLPTVAELNAAVAEIKHDLPKNPNQGSECLKCCDMGFLIDESDGLTKPCSCPTGQTTKANWVAWDRKHRR